MGFYTKKISHLEITNWALIQSGLHSHKLLTTGRDLVAFYFPPSKVTWIATYRSAHVYLVPLMLQWVPNPAQNVLVKSTKIFQGMSWSWCPQPRLLLSDASTHQPQLARSIRANGSYSLKHLEGTGLGEADGGMLKHSQQDSFNMWAYNYPCLKSANVAFNLVITVLWKRFSSHHPRHMKRKMVCDPRISTGLFPYHFV